MYKENKDFWIFIRNLKKKSENLRKVKLGMQFKIGLSLASLQGLPIDALLRLMNFLKFEHLEFASTNFKELFGVLDDFKGDHVAFHAPYKEDYPYDLATPSSVSHEVGAFINHVNKITEETKIHINAVVVHPPVDLSYDEEIFFKRLETLKPLPVLENIFRRYGKINTSWQTFSDWFKIVESTVNRKIGFCYDFPHAFINEGKKGYLSPPEYLLEHFRSEEGYAHISGSLREVDTHLPLTQTQMPMEPIFKFLKQQEFSGTLNMELSPMRSKTLKDFVEGVFESYSMLWKLKGGKGYWYRKVLLSIFGGYLGRQIVKHVPSLEELLETNPYPRNNPKHL
jgi:sugar phosphate isomerase/epimerase